MSVLSACMCAQHSEERVQRELMVEPGLEGNKSTLCHALDLVGATGYLAIRTWDITWLELQENFFVSLQSRCRGWG